MAQPWRGDAGGGAGHVDDLPAVGDQRQQRLSQEERPLEMHIEQCVELGLGHRRDRAVHAVASVVDQGVEIRTAPRCLDGGLQCVAELPERRCVRDVERQGDRGATSGGDVVHHAHRCFGIGVVGENHAHPPLGARPCRSGAQAAATSGNDDDRHVVRPSVVADDVESTPNTTREKGRHFLTYQAAAERGQWDRAALEADPRRWDEKQ
jgi:hypothetical protein